MTEYRVGNHWGVTIVREGDQPADATGHRPDAQLVAVVTNGDRQLAERICALLNQVEASYPHVCLGCGKHYATSTHAAWCDAEHRAHAERLRPRGGA